MACAPLTMGWAYYIELFLGPFSTFYMLCSISNYMFNEVGVRTVDPWDGDRLGAVGHVMTRRGVGGKGRGLQGL